MSQNLNFYSFQTHNIIVPQFLIMSAKWLSFAICTNIFLESVGDHYKRRVFSLTFDASCNIKKRNLSFITLKISLSHLSSNWSAKITAVIAYSSKIKWNSYAINTNHLHTMMCAEWGPENTPLERCDMIKILTWFASRVSYWEYRKWEIYRVSH